MNTGDIFSRAGQRVSGFVVLFFPIMFRRSRLKGSRSVDSAVVLLAVFDYN